MHEMETDRGMESIEKICIVPIRKWENMYNLFFFNVKRGREVKGWAKINSKNCTALNKTDESKLKQTAALIDKPIKTYTIAD